MTSPWSKRKEREREAKRKRQKAIVEAWLAACPDTDVLSFARVPSSLFFRYGCLAHELSEACDAYVVETMGLVPRLERLDTGPVPSYLVVRTGRSFRHIV